MQVVIDSREQSRISPASVFYTQKGLNVSIGQLKIGDYCFQENNKKIIFEYKTCEDLIGSINDGRIFNQELKMQENCQYRFIIVHGSLQDRDRAISKSRRYQAVELKQYLGAISRLNCTTTVIQVFNPDINEVFQTMLLQTQKVLNEKPRGLKFEKKSSNAAVNYLSCIQGISIKTAQKISDDLELKSLSDLLSLSEEQLVEIDGIGPKTANKIMEAIK